MLRLGFTHLQAALILITLNLLCVTLVLVFRSYGNSILLGLILTVCLLFNWAVSFFIRSKERENLALRNLFV